MKEINIKHLLWIIPIVLIIGFMLGAIIENDIWYTKLKEMYVYHLPCEAIIESKYNVTLE